MFDDANMRSGLYPFFHIALLNDFGSFAVCMCDRLFDSAHVIFGFVLGCVRASESYYQS